MKRRGFLHGMWTGVFLIGLLLALPGPAAASGFIHAQQHVPFTHAFQQHRFGQFGNQHHPGFFQQRHHGFRHDDHRRFDHGRRFHHPGFFQHHGFHGGSRTIFIWR